MSHFLHSQTFSVLEILSFLEKRTQNNTPSIKNYKCLTLNEAASLLSVKRNQQL